MARHCAVDAGGAFFSGQSVADTGYTLEPGGAYAFLVTAGSAERALLEVQF